MKNKNLGINQVYSNCTHSGLWVEPGKKRGAYRLRKAACQRWKIALWWYLSVIEAFCRFGRRKYWETSRSPLQGGVEGVNEHAFAPPVEGDEIFWILKYLLFSRLHFLTLNYNLCRGGEKWRSLKNTTGEVQTCMQCFALFPSLSRRHWKLNVQDLQISKLSILMKKVNLLMHWSPVFL